MDWIKIGLVNGAIILAMYFLDRWRMKKLRLKKQGVAVHLERTEDASRCFKTDESKRKFEKEEVDPAAAGIAGETIVAGQLSRLPEKYKVFHKVWLDSRPPRQIDHVVVSDDVVFVLETKNYSTKVRLSQSRKGKWYKKNGDYCSDNSLRNPFTQLILYVGILKNMLLRRGMDKVVVQPVVVSVGKLQLDGIASNIPIVCSNEICSYIVNYYSPFWLSSDKKQRLSSFFNECVQANRPGDETSVEASSS